MKRFVGSDAAFVVWISLATLVVISLTGARDQQSLLIIMSVLGIPTFLLKLHHEERSEKSEHQGGNRATRRK
jgi:hypothetical protein